MEQAVNPEKPKTLGDLVAGLVAGIRSLAPATAGHAESGQAPAVGDSPLDGIVEGLDAAGCVELVTALEQVRTMCSGVQMGAAVRLVEAREQELASAQGELTDARDFEAYRATKERVRLCSVDGVFRRPDDAAPVIGASDSPVFPQPGGRARAHRAGSTGVYAEVALARRQSPHFGARFTTTAAVTVARLPFTHSLVLAGLLSEHRAWIIVSTIAVLSDEQRTHIDEQLRDRYGTQVAMWSDRQLRHTVGALVAQLDAAALVKQHELACADARVSVRPAFAGMSYVTALMPAQDGIAIKQALTRAAAEAKADGDERAGGVIATETLRQRVLQRDGGSAPTVELVLVGTYDTFGPPREPLKATTSSGPRSVLDATLHWPSPGRIPAGVPRCPASPAASSATATSTGSGPSDESSASTTSGRPVTSELAVASGPPGTSSPSDPATTYGPPDPPSTSGPPHESSASTTSGPAVAPDPRGMSSTSAPPGAPSTSGPPHESSASTASGPAVAPDPRGTSSTSAPPGMPSASDMPRVSATAPVGGAPRTAVRTGSMFLYGHGMLPGPVALDVIEASARAGAGQVRVRRALHDPGTGQLIQLEHRSRPVPEHLLTMLRTRPQELSAWVSDLPEPVWTPHESTERTYTGALRKLVMLRDGGWCRTPWCGAPIRHLDHIRPHADDGPTSESNGQGLCVRCNLVKEQTGWSHARKQVQQSPEGVAWQPHHVTVTTPTGHRYASVAPDVLCLGTDRSATFGAVQPRASSPLESLLEDRLGDLLTDSLRAA